MNCFTSLRLGGGTLALALLCSTASGTVWAKEDLVKKTLDGRCLAPDHPEYWETNSYVAKPSMDACIKSGGKKG